MSFGTGHRPTLSLLLIASLFYFGSSWVAAQNTSSDGVWETVQTIPPVKQGRSDWIRPDRFHAVNIDVFRLFQAFDRAPLRHTDEAKSNRPVIDLPLPEGGFGKFEYIEAPTLSPELAGKFPEIRSFLGQGLDDPRATARFGWTSRGFHAQVLSPNGAFYIDPFERGETELYMSYYKRDYVNADKQWSCGVTEEADHYGLPEGKEPVLQVATGNMLREYQLAVACTHEYASAVTGDADPSTAPDPDPGDVLAAIVTTIDRVTGIYETELAITFTLIPNNDQLVFVNATSDTFTGNNDANVLINESQVVIDANIGDANYDIGHTFSTGAGGLAGVGVVCQSGSKARGVTGSDMPFGDPYDVDFVAHEVGHQFGADHTFNGTQGNCAGNRAANSAFEPGSGSTIMGYAGICDTDDIQPNSDPYFHFRSIDQIFSFITGAGGTCATATPTGNAAPQFSSQGGINFPLQVPPGTPFFLTTIATDSNAEAVSVNFEQANLGNAATLGTPDDGSIPLFRSFPPKIDPTRTFPSLQGLLNNTFMPNEILPSTNRTLLFRVTARDNRAGGGATNSFSRQVQVVGTALPFTVNTLNAGGSVAGGTSLNVQWTNPGGTFASRRVGIFLSIDGGQSFPFNLTPQTGVPITQGSVNVPLPQVNTTQARLQARAVAGSGVGALQSIGNYFFDVNNQNFTITGANNVLFLNGDFIQVPIVVSPFPGKMMIGGLGGQFNGTGAKFNANGTGGGAGVDIWGPGQPHHGYIISKGSQIRIDGQGFDGPTTVTVEETGALNRAIIQGHPFPGLFFERVITFDDDEKVFELRDTMRNETGAQMNDIKMADSIDPDQGVPLGFGFSTFLDVREEGTSEVPNQNDVAVSTITGGITVGFGMPAADSVPSTEGSSPWNGSSHPNQILFSPQDFNGQFRAEYLNHAHNFGNLAAGEEKIKFWYIFFGATLEEGVDNYNQKLTENADIEIEPLELFFGTIPNNTVTTPLSFTIRNVGTAELRFEGPGIQLIGISPDQFQFTVPPDTSPIPPGGMRTYSLIFAPTGFEGLRSAQVEISTNDPDDPIVFVELSGFGFQEEEFDIIAPDGAEVLFAGDQFTIRWFPETARIGTQVRIELQLGINVTVLAASTENDGEFVWDIPQDQQTAATYRIVITSIATPTIFDQSLNFFQIVNSAGVQITAPSAGQVLVLGETFRVQWEALGFASLAGQEVIVDVLKNGSFFASITGAVGTPLGALQDFWVVGQGFNVPPDADYQIRITHTATPSITDTSGFFTVIPMPLIVPITPNGESPVILGEQTAVTWRTFGNVGTTLRIELFKDGQLVDTLAPSVNPLDNSFNWNVDPQLEPGASYFIRIVSNQIQTLFGQTPLFSIIDTPTVTVASPNGGEFFVRGVPYQIRWTNTANDSNYITIELLKGGTLVETITTITQLSRKRFEFTPSPTLTPGDDYRVRISIPNFGARGINGPLDVSDESDENFSIGDGRPWYFAEGNNFLTGETDTDADFWETFLLLVNPDDEQAIVDITWYFEDQDPFVLADQAINPLSRVTYGARNVLQGLPDPNKRFGMSVVTKNGIEVFGERSIYWAPFVPAGNFNMFRGVGTATIPTSVPDSDWFLAEGTTTGGRETEIAVLNPNIRDSQILVTFLVQGGSPVDVNLIVPAQRRITIKAGDHVPNLNISTRIIAQNGVPIVVERTLYGPGDGIEKNWGHGALGVNNDAPQWFFAEGAVHSTFETFFLLGNTNPASIPVNFEFLLQNGSTINHSVTVSPNERLTVNVEQQVPGMTDQAGFSTTITSPKGAPFIAERSMFFRTPGFNDRSVATDVVGIPEPKTTWFLPEGAINGTSRIECFDLIGNPSAADAEVKVTVVREAGQPPVEVDLTVLAKSRGTVKINDVLPFGLGGTQSFSAVIESTNGVPIIVERAMFLGRSDVPINRNAGHAGQGFTLD